LRLEDLLGAVTIVKNEKNSEAEVETTLESSMHARLQFDSLK
jgi:hypothetical protein